MLKYDDRLICPIRSAASPVDKVCADKECAWFNETTNGCAMYALGTLCDALTGYDETTVPVFHVRRLKDTDVIVDGHVESETTHSSNEG